MELLNTGQWGGNTGQQGVFDPDDPRQQAEAIKRLLELRGQYGDRLQYNYTGDTGLAKDDAMGYSAWQNAITEADNIGQILGGNQPKNIRSGGVMSPSMAGLQNSGESPELRQARVNSQTASANARRDNPTFYRGR